MLERAILHNVIGVFGIVVTKWSYLSLFSMYIDNNSSTLLFPSARFHFLIKTSNPLWSIFEFSVLCFLLSDLLVIKWKIVIMALLFGI